MSSAAEVVVIIAGVEFVAQRCGIIVGREMYLCFGLFSKFSKPFKEPPDGHVRIRDGTVRETPNGLFVNSEGYLSRMTPMSNTNRYKSPLVVIMR